MTSRGVALVVYGERAETSARRALTALALVCPDLSVQVHSERLDGLTDKQCSRLAKTTMLDWSAFEHTLYLDADTQVYRDVGAGFGMLEDGWDVALCASGNQGNGQGDEVLWHLTDEERALTLAEMSEPLQLQAGVMFVARNRRTQALWHAWRDEWERFRDEDQGALLRALARHPARIWLLGPDWNGGSVIGHHWGACRR